MLSIIIAVVGFASATVGISSVPTPTIKALAATISPPSSSITVAPELDFEWVEELLKRSTTEIYSVSFAKASQVCGHFASGGETFSCPDNEYCAWNKDEGYYNGTLISMSCCGTLTDPGNGTAPYPDAGNCLNLFDSTIYQSTCLDYGLSSSTVYNTFEGKTSSTVYDLSRCSKKAPYCSGYSFAHLDPSYAGYQCGTVKTTTILNVRTDLPTITESPISIEVSTNVFTVKTTPIIPIRIGLETSAPTTPTPSSSSNNALPRYHDASKGTLAGLLSGLAALLLQI